MSLGLAEPLPLLVRRKFSSALAGKHLIFSATQLTTIQTTSGVPIQLRYCPALAKKPTAPLPESKPAEKKFDPFDNPSANLHIADIPVSAPTHLLVLNKYPVIAGHFIIATKEDRAQTQLLEEDDLALTLQCIREWETRADDGKSGRLFAFFNSGEHSGASQPHRHLQFLPVESMSNQDGSHGWKLLVDLMLHEGNKARLPFRYFLRKLSPHITQEELHRAYSDLYEEAFDAVREYTASAPGTLKLYSTKDGALPISYNLGITTDAIVLCPRTREGAAVLENHNSLVALNGTILSGSLMVKDEKEYQTLQTTAGVLDELLGEIGVPLTEQGISTGNRL